MAKNKNQPTCASLQKEINALREILYDLTSTKKKHLTYHRHWQNAWEKYKSDFNIHSGYLEELVRSLGIRLNKVEDRVCKDGRIDYELSKIRDTVQKGQESIKSDLEKYRHDISILRSNLGDINRSCMEYTRNHMKVHENEKHSKIPLELAERIKKLKEVFRTTLACLQNNENELNIKYILHECWSVLLIVEEQFEKGER